MVPTFSGNGRIPLFCHVTLAETSRLSRKMVHDTGILKVIRVIVVPKIPESQPPFCATSHLFTYRGMMPWKEVGIVSCRLDD